MSAPLTPYAHLRERQKQPQGWLPSWAHKRTVHRVNGRTVYVARPLTLTAADREELHSLAYLGWRVEVIDIDTHKTILISRKDI